MSGDHYVYPCDCGTEIRAETWDPHELPILTCPDCGDEITAERFHG